MKIEEVISQKKFESVQQKAWMNLVYTYNYISDLMNDSFKEFDITPQQYNVLKILWEKSPDPASCSAVKEGMPDKNPDLTRLCDRLVVKGLIQREMNEENRRQVVLRITDGGMSLLKKMEPVLKRSTKVLHNLSDKEAEKLSELLDKLRG